MKVQGWGLERALLALFVASGFAGLIYQAIWSHYLGLSLGHAAYAQTLVLAIFMGGMAAGAWLVSRRGVNWKRLIFAYAVVEILIGLAGLVFHPLFQAYSGFSQGVVYPALESELAVRAWQWGSAALLIAPQSILLGMTFPLMSGGYLRVAPRADGQILGGLYFTNSIGAAFGALFATFVLLPSVGMPGAMVTAGLVNLLVGLLAFMVSRQVDAMPLPGSMASPAPTKESPTAAAGRPTVGFYRMMLLAALVTGASSFVYEIGWVRMLNQSLGTTLHSFELMLAAFILGLAFGGLWIRRKSDAIRDAVQYAGYAQVWMGIAALISIPIFGQSFRGVSWLLSMLPRDDFGYALFSFGSGIIALLVMFPAAFFAGMTLPLFTMALLRRGAGEASIGRIYAANTLGAILGVALAVHVLIPFMGLRLAVTVAALADIVLGLVLLRLFADSVRPSNYLGAMSATLVALVVSLLVGRPSPEALASGVFRTGDVVLPGDAKVRFMRDGKTATVAVSTQGTTAAISTNGKPDASLELSPDGPPTADEITMLMAGALPLAIHPNPRQVAVIGWGSGLSTHTLLGSPVPDRVDSIEIERAMIDGASLFGDRVARAYKDPRSRIHIDDARTYFSTGHRRYDVIVSEPSNPWVSGVASLFTKEFYAFMRRHLNDEGIVVQWLQSYELDDPLLLTMVAALVEEFPYVDAYLASDADILFVASETPLPELNMSSLKHPALAAELARVGVAREGDIRVRRVASQEVLRTLVYLYGAEPYSDYLPVVALEAPRARFARLGAESVVWLTRAGMPIVEMTDGREPASISDNITLVPDSSAVEFHWNARNIHTALLSGEALSERQVSPELANALSLLIDSGNTGIPADGLDDWLAAIAVVADNSLSHLPAQDHEGVWINPGWIPADLPEPARLVLAAYDATARRDAATMHQAGLEALAALDPSRPAAIREHMLVIAELGAIASGKPEEVLPMERSVGRDVELSQLYGYSRSFLMAWADRVQLEQGAQ
ncbi:fused MFS/spermidine synthase [Arenimonas aestuarii]